MDNQNWRAPAVPEDEAILFDEPGRVLTHKRAPESKGTPVCYRAYHYRVTKPEFGQCCLRVKHGGGEERMLIGHPDDPIVMALASLDSDARFAVLHALREQRQDGDRDGSARTRGQYAQALVDGRLMKRKVRGRAEVKVWIEPVKAAHTQAAVNG